MHHILDHDSIQFSDRILIFLSKIAEKKIPILQEKKKIFPHFLDECPIIDFGPYRVV